MGEEFKQHISKLVTLDDQAWKAFKQNLHFKSFKRKELLLREGEICRQIFFIVKGYVRLYYLVDGVETTKDFNFESDLCGSYVSFKMQLPSRFSIVAMEALDVYLIDLENLFELFDKYPALQKFARLSFEKMFIRKEMREASFLIDDAETRFNNLYLERPQVIQRVPLKYIASYLGVTAETVSRIRRKI